MIRETKTLSNGVKIPSLALGTWQIPDEKIAKTISTALDLGYRHIDTAHSWENERGIGEAIRHSGIHREDLFVTSKVPARIKTHDAAAKAIHDSLARLDIGYIDLMLIHSPQPWEELGKSDNHYFEGNREVWLALTEAYKSGKVRAIGVSNFGKEDLDNLLNSSSIKPMVNQTHCHIGHTPHELLGYCQAQGIVVEAYSPVGHGDSLHNAFIQSYAKKYKVSVAQLCLKYDLQLGTVVLPKSTNKHHMRENGELNFTISAADMEALKAFSLPW